MRKQKQLRWTVSYVDRYGRRVRCTSNDREDLRCIADEDETYRDYVLTRMERHIWTLQSCADNDEREGVRIEAKQLVSDAEEVCRRIRERYPYSADLMNFMKDLAELSQYFTATYTEKQQGVMANRRMLDSPKSKLFIGKSTREIVQMLYRQGITEYEKFPAAWNALPEDSKEGLRMPKRSQWYEYRRGKRRKQK